MARILAISSRVVCGQVGLDATAPALQWLGHEVWGLPTVVLASRPGLGRLVAHALPASALGDMLSGLETDGCWAKVDAVFTGYFPSRDSVITAARAIRRIRSARPYIPIMVDPIVGDAGRLYVTPDVAEAIRDMLLPLATIATPNRFELYWLAQQTGTNAAETAEIAQRLGPSAVIVTSATETQSSITTLIVSDQGSRPRSTPKRPNIPNGAGDLFAGLLLGYVLRGQALLPACDAALADLDRVLEASAGHDVLQLSALAAPPHAPC
jgi:pyridoxine kinase